MSSENRSRNRMNLFSRFIQSLREKRRQRLALHQAPRNLAEALRDSGALQMPTGCDRFTGGWE